MPKNKPRQLGLFDEDEPLQPSVSASIPLELHSNLRRHSQTSALEVPKLPARWESARNAAESKKVLPALLHHIRPVPALDYLKHLVSLSQDEGYVWVVYGASGSGKSAFFHTLEYQTNNRIQTHIIDGNAISDILCDQVALSNHLEQIIEDHKSKHGSEVPLVIILEERENAMSTEERSALSQSLRNVLRPPKPGENVVFVLPVTNSNLGDLFMRQAQETGVSTPLGHNAIYTFQGPPTTEHVDILNELFQTLNDRDITDFGLQRSDLQKHVSSNQTIGQYIRVVREELKNNSDYFNDLIKSNIIKPFTMITCFVNPLPAHRTEPIIKGMTMNAAGQIRTGELLRVTQGQKAQRWANKRQALANIVSALDIRIVEIPPEIIAKLLYAYGKEKFLMQSNSDEMIAITEEIFEEEIDYNAPKSVRQNLRQQLRASNLFRILAKEETKRHHTPNVSKTLSTQEKAEIQLTKYACKLSHDHQHDLHRMFALALDDLLSNSGSISAVSDFKEVYPEPFLTLSGNKILRPDIVIEMQDRLFFLEFCWRSEEHFTDSDIANYILNKIQNSYENLPLIRTLAGG